MGKGYRVMLTGTALMLAFAQCVPAQVPVNGGKSQRRYSSASAENESTVMCPASVDPEGVDSPVNPGTNAGGDTVEERSTEAEWDEFTDPDPEEPWDPLTEEEEFWPEDGEYAEEEPGGWTDDTVETSDEEEPEETDSDPQTAEGEPAEDEPPENETAEQRERISIDYVAAGDANGEKVYDGTEEVDIFFALTDRSGNAVPEEAVYVSAWLTDVNVGEREVNCYFSLSEAYEDLYELDRTQVDVTVHITPRPLKLTVPDGIIESGKSLSMENIRLNESVRVEGFAVDEMGTSIVPEDMVLPDIAVSTASDQAVPVYIEEGSDPVFTGILKPETDTEGRIKGFAGENYYFDPELVEYGDLSIVPAAEEIQEPETEEETASEHSEETVEPETAEPESEETEAEAPEEGSVQDPLAQQEWQDVSGDEEEPTTENVPQTEAGTAETEESTEADTEVSTETEAAYETGSDDANENDEPAEPVVVTISGIRDGESVRRPVTLSFTCSSEDYLKGSCRVLFEGPDDANMPAPNARYENDGGIGGAFETVDADGYYGLRVKAQNTDGVCSEGTVHFTLNRKGSAFTPADSTGYELENYTHASAFPVLVTERNLDEVETTAVMIRHNGELRVAKNRTDYTRSCSRTDDGRYVYTYKLPAEQFADEGSYEVLIASRDRAGNVCSSEAAGCRIEFAIEREEKSISERGYEDDTAAGWPMTAEAGTDVMKCEGSDAEKNEKAEEDKGVNRLFRRYESGTAVSEQMRSSNVVDAPEEKACGIGTGTGNSRKTSAAPLALLFCLMAAAVLIRGMSGTLIRMRKDR